jgi:trans-aconitate methyltransferase
VHARLALRGDETLIDLGCGDGRLTAELAARVPRGEVIGLDGDADMVSFARRAHARKNLSFVHGDVRSFALGSPGPLARPADLVVSTACLHWVADHEAVLRRCRAHLSPGGRLSFQMGGRGCCAGILEAAAEVAAEPRWAARLLPFENPWTFRGPEAFEAALPPCGFRASRVALVPKDMVHPGTEALLAWMRTTWMPVLLRVDEPVREALAQAIASRYLAQHPLDADGRTHVDMVRLEVEAVAV